MRWIQANTPPIITILNQREAQQERRPDVNYNPRSHPAEEANGFRCPAR